MGRIILGLPKPKSIRETAVETILAWFINRLMKIDVSVDLNLGNN